MSQRSGGVKSEGAMAVNETHGWKNKGPRGQRGGGLEWPQRYRSKPGASSSVGSPDVLPRTEGTR